MAVGRAAEFGRGAGKQLGLGGDLRVHLEPDDGLPVAARAFEEIFSVGMNRHVTLCASRSVLSPPAASIHAMLTPDVALPPARSDDHGRPPWRSASRLSARSHYRRRPDLHLLHLRQS